MPLLCKCSYTFIKFFLNSGKSQIDPVPEKPQEHFGLNQYSLYRYSLGLPIVGTGFILTQAKVYLLIIPQVSFSQSDCSICGQYDVILPFFSRTGY